MIPFNTILFDLDGTLIDSVVDIAASVNHVRTKMAMTSLSIDVVGTYVGDGVHALMERSLNTQDEGLVNKAIELWKPHYAVHCLDHTRLYPGVLKILKALSSRGISLGVVSNKPAALSEKILAGLGVRSLFSVVVGGDTVGERKPHPLPLEFAVEQTKIHTGQILVVGDSPNDILGAQRAGYSSCGVLWGLSVEETIRAAHPDYLAKTPRDVQKIIL